LVEERLGDEPPILIAEVADLDLLRRWGDGIALTQWLYNGEDEHDLAQEMAA
jgi:hypothetical protein